MSMQKYQAAKEKMQEQMKAMRLIVTEAFNIGARELIEELGITSFGWRQYTPYFNDGDACIFSVRADPDSVIIDDDDGYDNYRRDPDNAYWQEHSTEEEREAWRKPWEQAKRVSDFINSFDEDDLLYMFDDHVIVTVTRDGAETEEYDHD